MSRPGASVPRPLSTDDPGRARPGATPPSAPGVAPGPGPTARTARAAPRVALVMSRFPAVTETFILRELVELTRQGVEVELVPLLRDRVSVLHPDAASWDRRALYSPFLSGPILRENLRALWSAPRTYLGTALSLLWEARGSWNALVGVLGVFPKSVWNGRRVRELGVTHIHAHYATHPAAAAYVMSRVHAGGEPDLPYSVTVHAHDLFVHQAGLVRKLGRASFVRSISSFNLRFLAEKLGESLVAELRSRSHVIHCGIRSARYQHRPEPGVPGSERPARILCVASHRPYKGLCHLIDAVALLRSRGVDVVCDVIGEGVLRPALEAQIRALGLTDRFRLVGTRTEDEVASELARSDLFVLPSIVAADGQMEGIPVVLMESLACGVPTVSTTLSGIPELVVDGETGWTVPPGDAGALADAVQCVLGDFSAALDVARAGRELVRREFELERNVERLIDCIRADSAPRTDP